VSALATQREGEHAVSTPTTDEAPSFEKHIQPLFRERDRGSMKFAFDLWSYEDVSENADSILGRLRDGSMPCDGACPAEQVTAFERWIAAGMPQ
jgi:hypothetical protein